MTQVGYVHISESYFLFFITVTKSWHGVSKNSVLVDEEFPWEVKFEKIDGILSSFFLVRLKN